MHQPFRVKQFGHMTTEAVKNDQFVRKKVVKEDFEPKLTELSGAAALSILN